MFSLSAHSRFTRVASLLGVILLGLSLAACGGSEQVTGEDNTPEWYLNKPSDPNYVFATASATSRKMQIAVDKAATAARGNLASQLETQIQSMTKSFTEEVGDELRQQYTKAQKAVTSRVLRGTSPQEREIYQRDNGTYRAFVLMRMPIGKAAKELMSKIKQNDEMYTRFRASQAFKEMQKAVKQYEKKQKKGMAQQQDDGGGQ